MNVELPDGTIIEGVPEGTSQKQLLDRLAQSGYDVSGIQRSLGPVAVIGKEGLPAAAEAIGASESLPRKVTAGLGAAGQRIAAGLGGLVGLGPSAEDVETVGAYRRGAGPAATAADIIGSIFLTAAVPANLAARAPGAAAAMRAAPRLFPIAGTAATGGLVAGATTPGDVSERGQAALLAAGLSGALPAVTGVAQAARRVGTRTGRELGRTEALRRELGPEASRTLVGTLRQPYPGAVLGVRPTAAMASGDPTLQALELGLRSKRGDIFASLDDANAAARWDAFQRVAGTAEDVAHSKIARDAATRSLREAALDQASQVQGFDIPVARRAAELMTGEGRVDPNVRHMAEYVMGQLEQGVTPEQLYRIRKVLTENVPRGTELGAAITSARRERMQLVESIDDALNAASNGTWGGYLRTYSAMSEPVTSGTSLQRVREFFEKIPGEVPPAFGASPAPRQLATRVTKEGAKEIGGKTFDRLSPTDRMFMEELMRDLTRQQAVMRARGIVGTDTAAKIAAGELSDDVAVGLIGQGVGRVTGVPGAGNLADLVLRRGLSTARQRALGEVLQNPERLAQLLEQAERAQRAFSATTEASRAVRPLGLE